MMSGCVVFLLLPLLLFQTNADRHHALGLSVLYSAFISVASVEGTGAQVFLQAKLRTTAVHTVDGHHSPTSQETAPKCTKEVVTGTDNNNKTKKKKQKKIN